jgi:hypothetical protein
MLRNELTLAICMNGEEGCHRNARPHMAHLTISIIKKLNREVIECHAHSADLVPSDLCLFEPLSNAQRGRQFVNYKEVKRAVYEWLHNWTKTFFSRGIKKLADRSAKCNGKKENCIEK